MFSFSYLSSPAAQPPPADLERKMKCGFPSSVLCVLNISYSRQHSLINKGKNREDHVTFYEKGKSVLKNRRMDFEMVCQALIMKPHVSTGARNWRCVTQPFSITVMSRVAQIQRENIPRYIRPQIVNFHTIYISVPSYQQTC